MESMNRLGLRVAGITAIVVVIVGGLYLGTRATWQHYASSRPTPQPSSAASSDALYADAITQLQNTELSRQSTLDSDGDGVADLAEINNGQNPAVAGPAGDNKPALGKQVTDLSTYTNRYLSTLPEDTPRDQIYTKERLQAYVDVNKGQLLPDLAANTIKTTSDAGRAAMEKYLNSISPDQNKDLQVVSNQDIEAAAMQEFQGDSGGLQSIATKLNKNAQILKNVSAPAEAVALHTKLIQATQALANNVTLLQKMNSDFVASLVGSKNIEELGPVFQDVGSQIQAFDKQYSF